MTGTVALIVAGGSGTRAGDGPPKQYRALGGVPLIRRSVQAFLALRHISLVQVVVEASRQAEYRHAVAGLRLAPPAIGGTTRQESVRAGLAALAHADPEFVLIHDAARPLVSGAMIENVIAALRSGAPAVVPLLPIADSLRQQDQNRKGVGIPRDRIWRAQTPQGFRFAEIRDAHERFAGDNASDDITLAERAGLPITAVPGEETNLKITTAADFGFAERLLAGATETRTGIGFDVHRFVPGDHLWLCGLRIPHHQALEGHSDADAGLHALTDAILGALAEGDIGQHFLPSDDRWRGASSRVFLEYAAALVKDRGGTIVHCDVTIICERPKLAIHREAMRASIGFILGLDISRVSVKATTTEGLGFTGRGEGLAAQAVATIRVPV